MQKKRPLVSTVITTKNEEEVLERLLRSLIDQSYTNIEIILVDNNSSDDTLKIAQKFKKVKIYQYGPERSAQRNFGAGKSKGEYLLFLDADMELTPSVIQNCVQVITEGNFSGVVIPEESIASSFWGKIKAYERSFYSDKGDPVTDAARFFKKEVFVKAGGYDESITGPEDWDLPDRIRESGYKIGRSSVKIYHHEHNISLLNLFKKKFYYGLNAHRYLQKHNIPLMGPKTIYFLRPLFYKNWKRLVAHPVLAVAMVCMLLVELLGGGAGYILGRIIKK
ncbi:MAG: glycosyltransferase [Actinobacteria bacterium]|nr:glycosyltransferase [Actinomycetota bacterium]